MFLSFQKKTRVCVRKEVFQFLKTLSISDVFSLLLCHLSLVLSRTCHDTCHRCWGAGTIGLCEVGVLRLVVFCDLPLLSSRLVSCVQHRQTLVVRKGHEQDFLWLLSFSRPWFRKNTRVLQRPCVLEAALCSDWGCFLRGVS